MPSNERPKKAGKRTSRDLAIVAIIVLIVIAAAAILQATRDRAAPGSSTSQAATPMTGAASRSASAPALAASPAAPVRVAGPNDVLFDDNSDRLPVDASAKLAVLADTARAEGKALTLSMQVENAPGAMDLARRRADAVRHALIANGVAARTIKSLITQTSPGLGSPQRVDRVFIVLR